MDTDSNYLAISGEKIEELVKPEKHEEFEGKKRTGSPGTNGVTARRGFSSWSSRGGE